MNIGIYGGSFNPPHKSHIQVVRNLLADGQLNKIIFVPVADNYNKLNLAGLEHRINMLKLATKNIENIEISSYDECMGFEYTYQYLDYFKQKFMGDNIYLIIGSDNLKEFITWKNFSYILNNYYIAVILRNNDLTEDFKEYSKNKHVIFFNSVTQNSSTEVRNNIKYNQMEKIIQTVDSDVIRYIKTNNLYKG